MNYNICRRDEEKYPIDDWRYDVAEGNTVLGYAEWVQHRKEADEGAKYGRR